MTAYAWDLLPKTAQQQIIDRVVEQVKTFRLEVSLGDIEDLAAWTVDALGRSGPVADEYERGFYDGAEVHYNDGHTQGYADAIADIESLTP